MSDEEILVKVVELMLKNYFGSRTTRSDDDFDDPYGDDIFFD